MLTQIERTETGTGNPPKQIGVAAASGSAIVYVVPVGRVFRGVVSSSGTNTTSSVGVILNGTLSGHVQGQSTLPLTLIEGTTVSFGGTSAALLGIEEDA
jgi:hypothetical protein